MLSPVDEIKSKIDIVDLIQEYLPLKQSGANFKARCPFHEEKTPSFMVNREKQFYHCFGCHESGDIFTFIQKMENIDFLEALKILANKAGVALPDYNPQEASLKTRVLAILEEAGSWFASQLFNAQTAHKALNYLRNGRQLNETTIKEWQLGYALDSWEALSTYLKNKGYKYEEIIQSGLVVVKNSSQTNGYYDRFRDRIMFPILDYQGNVVGFTGRAMKKEETAKYINTPQNLVYNKSEVVFGLFQAKQQIKTEDKVIIVEGNMDVISSHQAGIKNVVAVSGTALTEEQIKRLQRLTNNFIFAFDADEAGLRAAERSIVLAWQAEANVKVIAIPRSLAKDPDELIKKDKLTWQKLIKQATPAMDYFFDFYLPVDIKNDIARKKEATKFLLALILRLANPIEQDEYLRRLAERIDVREAALREAFDKAKARKYFKIKKTANDTKETTVQTNSQSDKYISIAERLLAAALVDNDYFDYINQELDIQFLPESVKPLYSNIVLYYTKEYKKRSAERDLLVYFKETKPDLINTFRRLIIIRDELNKLKQHELIDEIKKLNVVLRKKYIQTQLKTIEKQIKKTEQILKQNGHSEDLEKKLETLLISYSQLSHELKGI